MKHSLVFAFILLFLPMAGFSQGPSLQVRLMGCDSLPLLYSFNGFRFVPVQRGTDLGDNRFAFSLAAGPPRILFVGSTPAEHVPVIVGGNDVPLVDGHCLNMQGTEVLQSTINRQFRQYRESIAAHRDRLGALLASLAKADSPVARQPVLAEVQALDREKMELLQTARKANPLLGAYVGLFTYLSYPGLEPGGNAAEMEHFGGNYFAQADLSDPVYNRIPQIYDSYLLYTRTLVSLDMPEARRQTFLENALNRIPPGRPARKLAYAGVLEGLRGIDFGLYATYAGSLVDEFPNLDQAKAEEIRAEARRAGELAIGGQAPAFSQPGPDGKTVSLEGLRGKVVFIDFWASWCRPCRQENPRLRQIYSSFKGQGFELVGISLDVERDRWLQAIQVDKIGWPQGSDLLGWSNAAAQDYRVGAIPHNVLIDKQGRVLGRNLSVEELENRLKELL